MANILNSSTWKAETADLSDFNELKAIFVYTESFRPAMAKY